MTSFVYLNTIPEGQGGCTTFPNIGIHQGYEGKSFYKYPKPMDTRYRINEQTGCVQEWDWNYGTPLSIYPEKGMAVLHFCSLTPEYGGICDGNTFHIAEPPLPGNEKFVSQQFFSSCGKYQLPDDSLPSIDGNLVSNDII